MTGRERVLSALKRIETSRVPIGEIGGGYTDVIIQAVLGDKYDLGPDGYFLNHKNIRELLGADIVGARVIGPPVEIVGKHEDWGTETFRDYWGATHTQPPDATVQLVDPIAHSPEELDSWKPPEVNNFDSSQVSRWKTTTDFFVLATLNAGFDLGYELLGFERFMMWTIQAPEVMKNYYEKLIETTLIQPTFVTRLPAVLVPLAKACEDDSNYVDVFELEINGQEIAPGYSELNDPIEQRRRFESQMKRSDNADAPENTIDEDFLTAMEHGMPPAGGMGIGIDRLVMMLTGAESIRDVILFPQLRPKK